ncbi:MAG: hypothetical protein U0821_22240 [Chloroflexota bacterium]
MIVELRCSDRLRGPKALDISPVLSSVMHAAGAATTDLSRLRVVCDWIQYKNNFREPVSCRPILQHGPAFARPGASGEGPAEDARELALDLRRTGAAELGPALAEALDRAGADHVHLEPWGPGTASCIWGFNSLYWRDLGLWEQATGRGYEQALPRGESDARNAAAARDLILELFATWDALARQRALPSELHVVELGVGNGGQAKVWLDEFLRIDRERGTDYYRRLHYLMGDYSPHVLGLARAAVGDHGERVSGLVLDATRPTETLGFLRYKAFLVYISNVYDNLPTDEIVRMGGHLFRVEVRAYLPPADARRIAGLTGTAVDAIPGLVARLLRLGPELLAETAPDVFADTTAAVRFWQVVWEVLRLEERYVPLDALDEYEVAPRISGEVLRPILEANGDARMHVSNGAAVSFADSLALLHPLGMLQCHDLFVTDVHQYATGFRGPGKYDGSVVNWVNAPLLEAIGRRRGFDVAVTPFAHRAGANVQTLTARVRE